MWEAALILYALTAVWFLVSMIRDKYVELNAVVLIIYVIASLVWPITGIIYIKDAYK